MVFEIIDLANALPDAENSGWGNGGFCFIQGDIVKEIDNGYIHYYYVVGYQWGGVILEELCYVNNDVGFETLNEEYIVLSLNEYTPSYLQEYGISYEVEV